MGKRAVIVLISFVIICSVMSCGEDGVIDLHGDVEIPAPSSEGFQAVDFPTNSGSAWAYVNVSTEREFTLRIEDTRDIEGFTHRQMTVSELRPRQPDSVNREPIDHLSANALYLRIDSTFLNFALPIFATYFLKTPQSYVESAFDVFLPGFDNPVLHQKHFPSRLIWDFPLRVGKEWIVFENKTLPATRVVRRVIDANVPVTVPAGSYTAYVIEEEIVGLSREDAVKLPDLEPAQYEPAKYWVVPNIGVVKYEYTFLATDQQMTTLLTSVTFELKQSELPKSLDTNIE